MQPTPAHDARAVDNVATLSGCRLASAIAASLPRLKCGLTSCAGQAEGFGHSGVSHFAAMNIDAQAKAVVILDRLVQPPGQLKNIRECHVAEGISARVTD